MARHSRARFEALLEMLPSVAVLADIGAGDLDLARLALAAGRASRVVAVEHAPGAYGRARARAAGDARLEVRLGDGFSPIAPGEVDAAVLAGLGGQAIARILARARGAHAELLPSVLVVAPNAAIDALLVALGEIGGEVERRRVIVEGDRLRLLLRIRLGGGAHSAGELADLGRPRGGDTDDALWPAYVAERLTAWRRELRGAPPVRARALAQAIARVEASL